MTSPTDSAPEPADAGQSAADPAAAYLGLTVEEARLLAEREGRPIRVLAPGDLITMEYVEGRVNVTAVDGIAVRATLG
jgi:hypothetical protein